MSDQFDFQNYGANTSAPKYTKQNETPMPSRKELLARNSFGSVNNNKHLARNSFGSVNNNKHLDRMLGKK